MNDTASQIMILWEVQKGKEMLSSYIMGRKLLNILYQTSTAIDFFPF